MTYYAESYERTGYNKCAALICSLAVELSPIHVHYTLSLQHAYILYTHIAQVPLHLNRRAKIMHGLLSQLYIIYTPQFATVVQQALIFLHHERRLMMIFTLSCEILYLFLAWMRWGKRPALISPRLIAQMDSCSPPPTDEYLWWPIMFATVQFAHYFQLILRSSI